MDERSNQAICQVCACALDDDVVHCVACSTPHHEQCFRYAEHCSVYGCSSTLFVRPGERTSPPPAGAEPLVIGDDDPPSSVSPTAPPPGTLVWLPAPLDESPFLCRSRLGGRVCGVGDVRWCTIAGPVLHPVESISYQVGKSLGRRETRIRAIRRLSAKARVEWSAVATLAKAAVDMSPTVRNEAVVGLGRAGRGCRLALKALIRALADTDSTNRAAAASALALFGDGATAAAPILVTMLSDDTAQVRAAAATALLYVGCEVRATAPLVYDSFDKLPEDARGSIAILLVHRGVVGPRTLPVLLDVASRERGWRVEALVKAIGSCTGDLGPLAPLVLRLLGSSEWVIRRSLVDALGARGRAAAPLVQPLTRGISGAPPAARAELVRLLRALAREVPAAVDHLVAALSDGDAKVRAETFEALAELGPMAASAVDSLKRIVRTREGPEQRLALVALMKIAPEQPEVKQLLADAGVLARWTAQAEWYLDGLTGSWKEPS